MASIVEDPNGRKRILFVGADGKRRPIRLGKATAKQAEAFKMKVEQLVSAKILGHPPDDETSRWAAALDDRMRERLERAGLLRKRETKQSVTLGILMDEFFAAITVKAGTETTYRQTRRSLLDHFGEAKLVRDISPLDADKWRQAMKAEGLAEATISKRVKTARQVFRKAIRWKMLEENPLDDVKAGSQANKARMHFISRPDAQKVMDACPDAQWRLLFALSRYGGLRCPSEHLALTWADVDWGGEGRPGKVRVTSPKTEGHEGGEFRFIPLFPELRPILLEVFEQAEPGAVHVITRYRDRNQNLRTQLQRIIKRAGVKPWPKLFHNLRSTRQTELAEHHPIHVVCAWLGNSRAVAQSHYLQVTEAHFEEAAAESPGRGAAKAAQQPAELARTASRTLYPQTPQPPVLPGAATPCEVSQDPIVTPTGFEPVSRP